MATPVGFKAAVSIVDVIGRYVELRKHGREFKGLCPFHEDRNPSMSVVPHKEMFYCHSCAVGGDVIAFVRRIEDCSFQRALDIIGGKPDKDNSRPRIAYPRQVPAQPERICFAPPVEDLEPKDMTLPPSEGHSWALKQVWTYYGTGREVLFYVARYEWWNAEGDLVKSYRAWTYAKDGWKRLQWQTPRPLYNLHNLTQQPDAVVCLFEGEKAADAGGQIGGSRWVAASWPAGAGGVAYADFSPLQGRRVFLCPDPDKAGRQARDELLLRLRGVASEVWLIDTDDMPEGWDIADAVEDDGWDGARLDHWLNEPIAGVARLHKHDYGDEPVRAGLIAPDATVPGMLALVPSRAPPRKQTRTSPKVKNWDLADWREKLILSTNKKDGKQTPLRCPENATVPLEYAEEWKGLLAWDELRQCITTARPTPWGDQPLEWADHHDTELACWYDRAGLHFAGLISEAVDVVAHRNSFHPVRDYLTSLKWDGVKRIDDWLLNYCGTARTEFTVFVGKAWLISAVARAIHPGAQVKTCLILFGKQDSGKSEAFRILGGPWYAVQHGSMTGDSTRAIEQCSKAWIIEMAELATVRRAEALEGIKSFLSTNDDTYRPAYARRVQTIPRCCVFCGTSNPDEVFSDVTGNVRFWPVPVCEQIDLEALRRDRDQLWAEAVVRYRAGANWWTEDDKLRELAAQATEAYMVRDEWTNVIGDWLRDPDQRQKKNFQTSEILSGALKIEVGKYGRMEQLRVGNSMRKLGFEYVKIWYTAEELSVMASDTPKGRKAWRRKTDEKSE
jgi:predicted P-loop ATPase